MQIVLTGGPWSFDNHMLCLGRVQTVDVLNQIPLFHIVLWVQVHDLPVGFMSVQWDSHLATTLESSCNMMQTIIQEYGGLI